MSESREHKRRYNRKLELISRYERWIQAEPPMILFWRWKKWLKSRPVWEETEV